MKGLTRLEVALLKDAGSSTNAEVPWSPEVNEAVLRLVARGLVYLAPVSAFDVFNVAYEGHITSLGRTALLIALTEPSLITP